MGKEADHELRLTIVAEFEWDPELHPGDIGVAAEDGVVRLTGRVGSTSEHWRAERAAKRVIGVKGVVNEIEVVLDVADRRDDTDIAPCAVAALHWTAGLDADRVRVTVSNGWLTLDGSVGSPWQKRLAEKAVRSIRGLRGVTNLLCAGPAVLRPFVKRRIGAALKRDARLASRDISVAVDAGYVTLRGRVRSWGERYAALRATLAEPGIKAVIDRLVVSSEATGR